ncbi:PREDICTED: LRR receptor-like serine/threonine-protein kinase GSO2 isoform X2 [Ipomoea nil]|uniref:LRR receptor-like serine/threonine-protein kinase GSO2 isoform X2 n=1 Tax=Ipomoea nil TaxID=35883 RepID=UPI000901A675|nr:PREDICTED: LRR receptor-like serine/threonine-protein kinase GSO2 isoform X2 [Ipomoea nil]
MGNVLLWVILVIGVNTWGSLGCLEEERIALLQVKAHIKYSYDKPLVSWVDDKRSDCCKWSRVKCSNITGRVTELSLEFLRDERFGDWYINASIFLPFKQLNYLDLSENKLAGAVENEGFDKLSKLQNLEILDMGVNNLNRSILSSLSNLLSLKYLYLFDNPLNSHLNNSGNERLTGLINLEELHMRYTQMEEINILSVLNLKDFISLKVLDIGFNKFQSFGPINDVGGAKKLEELYLFECRFNQSIFQSLKGFPSLKILDLMDNDFYDGPLHIQDINDLRNLKELYLSDNYFEGFETSANHSAFPSIKTLELQRVNVTNIDAIHALKNLSSLEELHLDGSNLHKDFLSNIGPMESLKVLSLSGAQVGGTLPNKGLCELKNLQELWLSENQLEGKIPSYFGNLTSLRYVNLSLNKLSGNIELSPLSTLTSLEYLSIMNNSFEVASSFRSFANNSKLRVILADRNKVIADTQLQGFVPKFQLDSLSLSNCIDLLKLPRFLHYQRDLKVLRISRNNLEGEFPSWLLQNNTKLQYFLMNNNAFTGSLKLSSHVNPNLQIINVSNNKLCGEISGNFSSSFPNILALNLSSNLFSGQLHSLIGTHLGFLDLSNNSFTGEIPKEMLISCSSLVILKLSNNKLEGQIVQEFDYLSSLEYLHLDGNNFEGTIPNSLSNLPLHSLDIRDNKLSGEIPRWMGRLTSLVQLTLSKNHLEGHIPIEFCNLKSLSILDLSENNLTGSIPSCLNPSSIKHVSLSKHQLSGQLTRAFFNNTALVILDLSYNSFVGIIPEWIGTISRLSSLLLNGNRFEGKVPTQVCQLMRLSLLDLSNNLLSGVIPRCLGKISLEGTNEQFRGINLPFEYYSINDAILDRLHYEWGSDDEYIPMLAVDVLPEVQFRTKGNLYNYQNSILKYMSGIDLSGNKLTGEIPFELGNLTKIHALNLSYNNLSGMIPETLSKLENIESLDLSRNKLSGKIPITLINLRWLEFFSVAYNNLTGAIPEPKAQFATFDESSYEGNPYLCGPPLQVSCSSLELPIPPLQNDTNGESEESNDVDMDVFYISFGVAYVIFLLVVVLVLYINPYWRNIWFQLIEAIVRNWFCRGTI